MKLISDGGSTGRTVSVFLVLLTIFLEATGSMMCRKDSICTQNNIDACCLAVNSRLGMCSPKIQLGKKCHKNIRMRFLSNDGFAFTSCGCARGLTCTKIYVKRRKQKKGKKAYRTKYRCLPINSNFEVLEHRLMSWCIDWDVIEM